MNFYIDKPTLHDIPAMRNLVLPEVQRGIILDRTEDEMAGVIRSYSVIRIVLNSSLGTPCGDLADFGHCADSSLALHPKSAKNSTTSTANTRICDSKNTDSVISQNLDKNNPRVSANLETRPLRGAKNREQGCSSATADFLLEAEKRGSPPKSEKRQLLARRGSGVGGAALLRKESSENNDNKIAESSVDSAILSQNGLPRRFCESARNDNLKQHCESEFASPIIAFAALQILSLTLGEVRSLIVDEKYRRNGLATMLIEHLLAEARALNLKEVLALTYQREVFEKLGFKEIAKESLPNQKIWADCIKCKKFPVCDEIALTKIL